MELQGNTEGGLDLYRAAQKIYSAQVTSSEFLVKADDAKNILNLRKCKLTTVPSLSNLFLCPKAVTKFSKGDLR